MILIHINGWPGAGKLTVGRALAERLGGALLDNHTLLNPAEALFDRKDPGYAELRSGVRRLVLQGAAADASKRPLVVTDALGDDEAHLLEDWRLVAAARHALFLPVVLDCAWEENRRRLVSQGRKERHKLTRIEVLDSLRKEHALLRPADAFGLDATFLLPEESARRIEAEAERRGLPPKTSPAT